MPPKLYRRLSALLLFTVLLVGCASIPLDQVAAPEMQSTIAVEASSCRDQLNTEISSAQAALDPTDIRLLNWNIQKSLNEHSLTDLDTLATDTDLVLIQEAALASGVAQTLDAAHWSFAPGYETRGSLTGVMTLSTAKPVNRCNLTSTEPWLRSPKATSVTEYALAETDDTLVVVNIHAVNFTFGTRRFREQFEAIAVALTDHDGPVILSGDFNTWNKGRMDIVNAISHELGLEPVRFDDDQRTIRFGRAIDHVYVRGLTEIKTATHAVTTSDHNPMIVHFGHEGSNDGRIYSW